jgi:hypothetical protein
LDADPCGCQGNFESATGSTTFLRFAAHLAAVIRKADHPFTRLACLSDKPMAYIQR